MQEQLLKIVSAIKKNIDRTVIIVFAVIMITIVYIYLKEINSSGPSVPEPGSNPMEKFLPSLAYENVKNKMSPVVKFENNKSFSPLGQFNMFDSKSVKTKEQIEQDILSIYDAAQKMFSKAEAETKKDKQLEYYQNTVALCKKILIMKREHSGAFKLLGETEAKIKQKKEAEKNPPKKQ